MKLEYNIETDVYIGMFYSFLAESCHETGKKYLINFEAILFHKASKILMNLSRKQVQV